MPLEEFTLVIDGGDVVEGADALYEAGCDDATFSQLDGQGYGGFDREAPSLAEALATAIRDVESVAGLRVRRVEPDDLVTLSEIAQRLDRSRESVRLLAAGERGPGGFPGPVSHLRTRHRLWRWSDVAAWAGIASPEEAARATLVAALNAALELRSARGRLAPAELEMVRAMAG